MSETVEVSAEDRAKDDAFLEDVRSGKVNRVLHRHGKLGRFTHATCAISCGLLAVSGLFTFIPPLTQLAGQDVVFFMRMAHRVLACIFIGMPVISLIASPKGAAHICHNLFHKWDSDDKKWIVLFFPYLFLAKWVHMPDQSESKSGQRFADGMIWFSCILMIVSGIGLIVTGNVTAVNAAYGVFLFLHDLGFCLIAVFGMAHIFLGAGIFQPYRGMARAMWGDGNIDESQALYHWGHWAREALPKVDRDSGAIADEKRHHGKKAKKQQKAAEAAQGETAVESSAE